MSPEPIQTLKSEPTSQERGATGNSLEQTTAKSALPPERPKLRSNSLPEIPTPDMRTAALEARLVKAGVPQDQDFINGLLRQLITAGDLGGRHDDLEVGFLLSVMEGIKPHDTVAAMIASQMALLQTNIVKQSRRLNRTVQGYEDGPVNSLTKLIRTFVTLSDALTRHRNGGGPNVSVGHVSFGEGSQAIVGTVNQSRSEVAPEETAPSPPLLVDAKAVPMPSVENKEQVPVPVSRAGTEEQRTFEKK